MQTENRSSDSSLAGFPQQLRGERNHRLYMTIGVAAVAISAVTVLVFRAALFNFFAGDDYSFLPFLRLGINRPEIVLRQFWTPWMDDAQPHFYRPLVSVMMLTEYWLWGANGCYFRMVNLISHLANSFLLGLIVFDLCRTVRRNEYSGRAPLGWAISAAAMFALYPLHVEAVNWIIGCADTITTLFCLLSFWFYTRWRLGMRRVSLFFSCLLAALAFSSKEIAVTIPPLCFIYEMLIGSFRTRPAKVPTSVDAKPGLFSRIRISIKATLPLWAVLGCYLCVRYVALGTLIGGYDSDPLFVADKAMFVKSWLHALGMTFVPVNGYLIGTHSSIVRAWTAFLGLSVAISVAAVIRNRNDRTLIAFLLLWAGLSLAPVFKIFSMDMGLTGSRYAYLFSAPLCVLIVYGFVNLTETKAVSRVLYAVLTLMLGLAATMLFINNQAWAEAGRTNNNVLKALNSFYKATAGDPDTLIIGLPHHIKGVPSCSFAIDGMTKKPLLYRDIYNCMMLSLIDRITPFGYMKERISHRQDKVRLESWDAASQQLFPVTISDSPTRLPKFWAGIDLRSLLSQCSSATQAASWNPDGSLKIIAQGTARDRPSVLINLDGLSCWSTDFISIKLRVSDPKVVQNFPQCDLCYTNDLVKDYALAARCPISLKSTVNDQELLFPLRSIPSWAFGGHCHGMKLLLPPQISCSIKEISIEEPNELMPKLSLEDGTSLKTIGTVRLDKEHQTSLCHYDAQGISNCKTVGFQITRTAAAFEIPNSSPESKSLWRTNIYPGNAGAFTVKLSDFPMTGAYQGRLVAFDASGKALGVAGDHVLIIVRK